MLADKSKEMGSGEAALRLQRMLEIGTLEKEPTALREGYSQTEGSTERREDSCDIHRMNKGGENTIDDGTSDEEMTTLEEIVAESVARK